MRVLLKHFTKCGLVFVLCLGFWFAGWHLVHEIRRSGIWQVPATVIWWGLLPLSVVAFMSFALRTHPSSTCLRILIFAVSLLFTLLSIYCWLAISTFAGHS